MIAMTTTMPLANMPIWAHRWSRSRLMLPCLLGRKMTYWPTLNEMRC